jgi:hypothetical protein
VSASRQAGLWELITTLGVKVSELPADLAAIDTLLTHTEVYGAVVELWRAHDVEHGTSRLTEGRSTIAIETFVRLIVLKVRPRSAGIGSGRRSGLLLIAG